MATSGSFVCFVALRPKSTAMVMAGRCRSGSDYVVVCSPTLYTLVVHVCVREYEIYPIMSLWKKALMYSWFRVGVSACVMISLPYGAVGCSVISNFGMFWSYPIAFRTVKPVLSGHLERRPKIGFQNRLSVNAGQSIAECSLSTFIYFYHWS